MDLKEAGKRIIFPILSMRGLQAHLIRKINDDSLTLVLNFHKVSPQKNSYWSPLPPDIFEELLIFLKKHFNVILFRDLKNVKTCSEGENKGNVIISFDDGYYDFLEYAVPILRKHDIRANMNIIASSVKTGAPPLNIQLVDFLNESPKSLIDEIKIPGFNVRLKTDSEVDKIKFGLQISGFFKNRPRKDFLELWASLMPVMSKVDISNATRMLDFDQVKEVAGTHEIGAHSYSHQSMEFESDQFFEQDFLDCKKFMDEELGLSCYIYAFPNGSHRESQINSLREWGGGGFCVAY